MQCSTFDCSLKCLREFIYHGKHTVIKELLRNHAEIDMATAHDDGALFPCSVCKHRLASLFYTGFLFHYFFSSQARFWVQVMRDLREGVKLKKVQERQYNPLPIEYQLTPYEMLMDDIRSKRYKLRKVMVSVKTRVAALKILLECCTQCCTVVLIQQEKACFMKIIRLH